MTRGFYELLQVCYPVTPSTRESNEPYTSVYMKEFKGAIWDHASMRLDLDFLIKTLRHIARRATVTIRRFGK